ncbi:MAG: T9SS type A sorting domain-containing protein [Bacteroidetes bacterium]|nr:T9SS type A sorting domain-containing protein [Bacteroidota bacterium]
MKKFYQLSATLMLAVFFMLPVFEGAKAQTVITRWNFNGPASDQVPGGPDSPSPAIGNGIASLVGGTTATFASGTASGGSSDPETTTPPNYGWNTTNYPAQGTAPKSAGAQFRVSTLGYDNIQFVFDQRLSNTAANTWVVQYTTDVTASSPVWVDAQTFTFEPQATGTGDTWYNQRTVNLAGVAALNNNPNAAFRVVSDFDPTTGEYRAARSTSSYGTGGTSRFDMVTVLGTAATSLSENNLRTAKIWFDGSKIQLQTNAYMNGTIEVFDLLGNRIHFSNISGTQASLTAYLSPGLVMVRLTDQSGRQTTRKVIVK